MSLRPSLTNLRRATSVSNRIISIELRAGCGPEGRGAGKSVIPNARLQLAYDAASNVVITFTGAVPLIVSKHLVVCFQRFALHKQTRKHGAPEGDNEGV